MLRTDINIAALATTKDREWIQVQHECDQDLLKDSLTDFTAEDKSSCSPPEAHQPSFVCAWHHPHQSHRPGSPGITQQQICCVTSILNPVLGLEVRNHVPDKGRQIFPENDKYHL